MSRARKAYRSARGWGNSLGGYKTQPRDSRGRFSSKGNTRTKRAVSVVSSRGISARTRKNSAVPVATGKRGVLKNAHKVAQARGGGVVPYARLGVGHTTVGVNGGLRVSKNRRVSAGFYVRTENTKTQQRVKRGLARDQAVLNKVANPLRFNGRSQAQNASSVRRRRDRVVRSFIGGEKAVPGFNAYGRVGTDRNGVPTVNVRGNSAKSKNSKSRARRDSGVVSYNQAALRSRGKKVSKPRPQRRRSYAKR